MATPRFVIRMAVASLVVVRGAHRALIRFIGDSLGDEQVESMHIEEIFDALQIEDDDAPCVCGSHDHKATHQAFMSTIGQLDNGPYGMLPVTVEFTFDETDSMAVTMQITLHVEVDGQVVGHDTASWTYARDILDGALGKAGGEMVGDGDVSAQLGPDTDEVHIWLTHQQGTKHRLSLPAEPVRTFMITSYRLVPGGRETANVDEAITRLLGEDQ